MPIDTSHEHLQPGGHQWTVETALAHIITLVAGNDRRYEQRFEASQKALELGLASQKAALDHAALANQRALDVAVTNNKESFDAALNGIERAVLKAEVATEKRFESVNEFRSTLTDQQRTFIPRSEVEAIVHGVHEKIAQLTKVQDAAAAERLGIKGGWGYAVGVAGFVALLLALFGPPFRATPTPAPTPQVIYVPAPPNTLLPSTPPATVPR